MTTETKENLAYRHAFAAVELLAASANIDMRKLHHRYNASTGCRLLRQHAASHLRIARELDRETALKVWQRHKPQAAGL